MTTTYTDQRTVVALTAANIDSATFNTACHLAGGEYDNSAGLIETIDLEVLFQLAATPVAGDPIKFYIVSAPGGTTYEDGVPGTNDGTAAASPVPDPARLVAVIGALADTSAHRINRNAIPVPACKFKLVAYNGTTKSQATSNFAVNVTGNKRETTTP